MIFRLIYRRRRRERPAGPAIEQLRKEAKAQLPSRVEALARMNGFIQDGVMPYNRVCIKNNLTNWGSCSAKRNINLNLQLMRLPEHLRDFVILHELCHLQHMDHGKEFHQLLDKLCEGKERQLQKELKQYHIRTS